MALYLKTAGGNWTDAATWSATSAAGVDNAGPPTSSTDCIAELLSGNVTISASSSGKSFSATAGTGNWGGTLTHNAFTLTISGSVTFSSTMTYTPASASAIIATNAASTLTTSGKLLGSYTITGASNATLGDNLSFMASKTSTILIGVNCTLGVNSRTISGNSSTNRLLITSSALGTGRVVGITSGTFANADFRDIIFNSASNLDLSAITGNSGDCGGNSITGGGTTLTFTTTSTQTWDGTTANWDTAARWTSRVPLPQDTVVLAGTNVCTANMPRLGKDISFSAACPLTLANAVTSYGSVNFTGTGALAGAFGWTFESQARTGTLTLTSAGKAFVSTVSFSMAGTAIISLADAFTTPSTVTTVSTNSLSLNSYTHSFTGTGTIFTGAGTITAGTSIIALTDTSATAKTFAGGGKSYYNLAITGGGTGAVILTGSNTFNSVQVAGGTKTLTFPSTVTTTINGSMSAGFGNGANLLTLKASTGGSAATTNYTTGGTINANYLDITDINVTPASTWYYGNNSSYHSGTGWNSGAAPTSGFAQGTMNTITNRLLRHFDSNSGPIIHRTQNRLIRTR